jgi:hypothetical protein
MKTFGKTGASMYECGPKHPRRVQMRTSGSGNESFTFADTVERAA